MDARTQFLDSLSQLEVEVPTQRYFIDLITSLPLDFNKPENDDILCGALIYCLEGLPSATPSHNAAKKLLFFWQRPTLIELIQARLAVNIKEPLSDDIKIIHLAVFLKFIKTKFLSEPLYTQVKDCTAQILKKFMDDLIFLSRQKPTPLALKSNMRSLLLHCQQSKELASLKKQFLHLLYTVENKCQNLDEKHFDPLPPAPGEDWPQSYCARYGAILCMLSSLEKTTAPQFTKNCRNAINLDKPEDLKFEERLNYYSGLYFTLPKEGARSFSLFRDESLQDLVLRLMNQLHEVKGQNASIQNINSLSYFIASNIQPFLGRRMNNLLSTTDSAIRRTLSTVETTVGSATELSSNLSQALFSHLPAIRSGGSSLDRIYSWRKELMPAFLILPNELLDEDMKIGIENAYQPRVVANELRRVDGFQPSL